DRESGPGTCGKVQLEAIEGACRAGADGAPVAPRCVGVGVPLTLRSTLVDVPLAVRERGHVRGVDSHVHAVVGQRVLQRSGDGIEAVGELVGVGAQLLGEAIERPHGRAAADSRLQPGMLRDQRGNARPGGKREQGLDEASADESAGTVALAARPAERTQLAHESGYFGGVENFRDVRNSRAARYLAGCHWWSLSCGHAPGGSSLAGALFLAFAGLSLFGRSDGAAPVR